MSYAKLDRQTSALTTKLKAEDIGIRSVETMGELVLVVQHQKQEQQHHYWHFNDVASPRSAAHVVCTSRSTVTPKDVPIKRAELCRGTTEQAEAVDIDDRARVL
ncbi:hypothetical protein LX32DRAFT_657573 [Colletotrichum zoysiae]|uniref:Uncharacterized protein n=1 Tax=Colletotrichum zoysiae TaxID=1216348 RepID=A0AAD9H5J1_9PEZI|nr:hypothetical protein LX32DRAFT_657573 [Colletotrichum zoysiae]